MDSTYDHKNYDITIKKCTDSVYIQFIDKQIYKMYSNTLLKIKLYRYFI